MWYEHNNWIQMKHWFRSRRFPIQRTVRPEGVVVDTPLFNENLYLLECRKNLSIEEFVSRTGIKAFTVSVFPWTAWFDISSFCSKCSDPVSNWLCYKLRSIIGPDVSWESLDDDKISQWIDNILWVEFSIHRIARHSRVYSSRIFSVLNA